MKRFVLLVALFIIHHSLILIPASAQSNPDTVNGWFLRDGSANTSTFSRLVTDTVTEGAYSQSFWFNLPEGGSVRWQKEYNRMIRTPKFFRVDIRMDTLDPRIFENTIVFKFFLKNGDSLFTTGTGGIGALELHQWWEFDLSMSVYGTPPDSFSGLVLSLATAAGATDLFGELKLDNLRLLYMTGINIDSIVTLDRFGDDVQPPTAPQFTIEPQLVDFDSVLVGSERVDSALVRNAGNDTLRITSVASDVSEFTFELVISTIPPGDSARVRITFRPTTVGARSGNIIFTHNASTSPDTLCVSGVGTITTDVADYSLGPTHYSLAQNYPNPFNPETRISYTVSRVSMVTLTVYDALGREITLLVAERKSPGRYEVRFDASSLPSGIYFYRLAVSSVEPLQADGFVETKKMILMK